jgi:hypothetical protein
VATDAEMTLLRFLLLVENLNEDGAAAEPDASTWVPTQ